MANRSGNTRCIDMIDFLQYITPTLVVEPIQLQADDIAETEGTKQKKKTADEDTSRARQEIHDTFLVTNNTIISKNTSQGTELKKDRFIGNTKDIVDNESLKSKIKNSEQLRCSSRRALKNYTKYNGPSQRCF
ncbi:hypothetical protein BDF21DRAFT_403744 [Thamnidium elegans]|nr:hypothetical protein BDF21DRAFT_403744 [Thamnidium elegans]